MTFTFNAPKSRKWSNFSFLLVWSFQKTLVMFEWFSMSNTMAKSISSIKICSIESIRCTKLKKMTKTLVFGHLDHSKRNVFWFLNDSAWEIRKPNRAYHLVLSKYAMSSQSDDPNWRNWLKISFLAILIVQKDIFPIFEWSRTIDKIAKSCSMSGLLHLLDLLDLVVIRFVKKCDFKHSEPTNSLKTEQNWIIMHTNSRQSL